MKIIIRTLLLLFTICVAGCTINDPAKLWFYTYSTEETVRNDTLLTPTSFLNLKKDGTYTRDFGQFDYGKWAINGKELLLASNANVTFKLPIKYTDNKVLQLVTDADITSNFEAQPISADPKSKDPFSLANNRWRIPATHKESEEEIRARLLNHFSFWAAYFTWALDNNLDIVDVRSTPTLIKIYGNGFGLKPYEELPAAWRSYFFDVEDCKIANNLVDEVFQFHEISWAHTDNKYKMFIGAFQQLQQFLIPGKK